MKNHPQHAPDDCLFQGPRDKSKEAGIQYNNWQPLFRSYSEGQRAQQEIQLAGVALVSEEEHLQDGLLNQ